jgi:hypothetical protein
VSFASVFTKLVLTRINIYRNLKAIGYLSSYFFNLVNNFLQLPFTKCRKSKPNPFYKDFQEREQTQREKCAEKVVS